VGGLSVSIGTVDEIIAPAIVIPKSCDPSDYFLLNSTNRGRALFYDIPIEFVWRDDWPEIDFVDHLKSTVHTDPSLTRYFEGPPLPQGPKTREVILHEREIMYDELTGALDENEKSDDDSSSEEGEED